MASKMLEIPLDQIREQEGGLREVNRESEGYRGLVDSIRSTGIKNPILVRPLKDENGNEYYGLVDGLHRFSASKEAGKKTIPALVEEMADDKVIENQIIANIHNIETRPVEYSRALQKILQNNMTLTEAQLGKKLSKSGQWIKQRLGLLRLHEKIQPLVDEGKIVLSNAYALASLEPDDQLAFLDRAQVETPNEFMPACDERRKEVQKARRQGRDAKAAEFVPTPHLQKLSAFKDEYAKGDVGKTLCKQAGVKTAQEGFALAIQWSLHLDPTSVENARVKWEERQQQMSEKKEKAKAERIRRRQEKAQLESARLQVEAEAMEKGEDVDAALAKFDQEHNKE